MINNVGGNNITTAMPSGMSPSLNIAGARFNSRMLALCQTESGETKTAEYEAYAGSPTFDPPAGVGGGVDKDSCVEAGGESMQCFTMTGDGSAPNRIMIGFTKAQQSAANWTYMDWGVYFLNGQIRVYGRNNPVSGSGSYYGTVGTVSVGDEICISVDAGGNVILSQNGTDIFTWVNQLADADYYPAFYAWGTDSIITTPEITSDSFC